jgi:hypothetical protein
MINRYLLSLSRALWDSELIATRISLFLAELLWAVMLIWPGDTVDGDDYALMHIIAQEGFWAVIFTTTAMLQLLIVLTDNLHSKFARYFAAWNAFLWLYVSFSMLFTVYPLPAAIAGNIALAFAACWICIRPYILAEGYKHAGY